MKKKPLPRAEPLPDLEVIVPITAAHLQALARFVQVTVTTLLLPKLLERLKGEAERGAFSTLVRMDQLMGELRDGDGQPTKVCKVETARSLATCLQRLGFACQIGKYEDDRSWERLCIEISWREVANV